jgi:hypothetical protein
MAVIVLQGCTHVPNHFTVRISIMYHAMKVNRPARHASALALAVVMLAPAAHAATFNFSAGFPGGNPGSGTWNYVERDTINSQETILSHLDMAPYAAGNCWIAPCWTPTWNDPTQSNQVPLFLSNNTNVNWQSYGSCCQAIAHPRRCLIVHPGNAKDAVVRFTVPAKPNGGSYTIAHLRGNITDQDFNGGNGVNWSVELNLATQFGGSLNSTSSSTLSSAAFPNQALPVTTGSVINVVVNSNNADEFFDTTAVCGSITLN